MKLKLMLVTIESTQLRGEAMVKPTSTLSPNRAYALRIAAGVVLQEREACSACRPRRVMTKMV